MNSLKSLGSALLVIAILIASYGIYHAPTSDASQLEAELEKNEQELAREEATPAGFPSKTPDDGFHTVVHAVGTFTQNIFNLHTGER